MGLESLPFLELAQPCAGVLREPVALTPLSWADRGYSIYSCRAGGVSSVYPSVSDFWGARLGESTLSGTGLDVDPDRARLVAVAEAAERYALSVVLEHEVEVASANELGSEAIDWRRFPRLGMREQALPGQWLCPFDPDVPIRWVRGLSLVSGARRYVPLVLTHLYPRPWATERFTSAISTGVAAHTCPVDATLRALLEVVERDAIALTWLLRPSLRRIDFARSSAASLPEEWIAEFSARQFHFFDATTDVRVPTIYLMRHRPGHSTAANLVACATSFSVGDACVKAAKESASMSFMFEKGAFSAPEDALECTAIWQGAAYMGTPAHSGAFRFLTEAKQECSLDQVACLAAEPTAEGRLRAVVDRLAAMGAEPVAVELTTDELRDVGLRVVRVVVPELMPMSTIMRARFLGHARLYEYARHLGMRGFSEEDVNPDPQPFA